MYDLCVQNRTVVFLVLIIALLFQACNVGAQSSADQPTRFWKAQWIAASHAPQRDEVVLHFRKVVELSGLPQHFYVDVSADNQFIFHVNQQWVGSGPSRSDLAHWRYETYDLGPFLRTGKNVLA